jgi:hypothetical protein
LKVNITKEEWEKLNDAIKELYKEDGDSYKLDIEGNDDSNLDGLKKHADRLLEEKKAEEQKRRDLEAKLAELELKDKEQAEKLMIEKGEFDKLLEQKTKEFEEKEEKYKEQIETAQSSLKNTIVNTEVSKLALEWSDGDKDVAEIATVFIKDKIIYTDTDDGGKVLYLDPTGVPNPNMTADGLKEQLLKDKPALEKILAGRRSNGGGAGGGAGGGGELSGEWDQYFNPAEGTYNAMKQGELKEKDEKAYKMLRDKYKLDDPFANRPQPKGVIK